MSVSYNIIYLIWLLLIVVSIISFYSSHSVSFFILLSFLVILSYSIQCSSNQHYVKITKTTTYDASEDHLRLYLDHLLYSLLLHSQTINNMCMKSVWLLLLITYSLLLWNVHKMVMNGIIIGLQVLGLR